MQTTSSPPTKILSFAPSLYQTKPSSHPCRANPRVPPPPALVEAPSPSTVPTPPQTTTTRKSDYEKVPSTKTRRSALSPVRHCNPSLILQYPLVPGCLYLGRPATTTQVNNSALHPLLARLRTIITRVGRPAAARIPNEDSSFHHQAVPPRPTPRTLSLLSTQERTTAVDL